MKIEIKIKGEWHVLAPDKGENASQTCKICSLRDFCNLGDATAPGDIFCLSIKIDGKRLAFRHFEKSEEDGSNIDG